MTDEPKNQEKTSQEPDNSSDEKAPKKLTPEEQLALYEEQLKEEDWGHQPC